MRYVKCLNINGVDARQVACIELHGAPNAATEGAVGVLGIDVDSPTHDLYRCVAVNGSIYTWKPCGAEGSSGYELPVPTLNTEKVLEEEGYYAVYAIYSTIPINFGVFYYAPNSLGQSICADTYRLYINSDGSMVVQTIRYSVNDSGAAVASYTEIPYYYSIYTAKL